MKFCFIWLQLSSGNPVYEKYYRQVSVESVFSVMSHFGIVEHLAEEEK